MKRRFVAFIVGVLALACGAHEPSWRSQPMGKPAARAAVSGEIAQETRSGKNLAGGSIALGYEAYFGVSPAVNRTFYGEIFGVEARGHFLRSLGDDSDTWLIQTGAAFSASKLLREGPLDQLRYPAFFPLLLPEIGAAFRRDEPAAPYFRWSAPFAFLIHRNVAIELSPSVSLLAPTPKPNPDVLVALDFGLWVREIRRRDSDDGGYDEDDGWGSWKNYRCFADESDDRRYLARTDLLDLRGARPYRRHFAVTRVSSMAHHFVVTQTGSTWENVVLRAERRPAGGVAVEWDKAAWGGSPPESELEPVPPELKGIAAEVEARAREHCYPEGPITVRYAGAYRDVVVLEFVVHRTIDALHHTIGWQTRHGVAMDEGLTRVLRSESVAMELDQLKLPKSSQWLPSSGAPGFKPVDPPVLPEALTSEIRDAARRFDLGAEPAEIASLVPADAPRIPADLTAHLLVTLTMSFPAEGAPTSKAGVVATPLTLRDAVFGSQATGEVEASAGDIDYTIRATLAPTIAIPNVRGFRTGTYDGTFTIHVADTIGRTWDQSFEVSGSVELDGGGVLAPNGLTLSTESQPSVPSTKLRGELPRKGPASRVIIFLSTNLPQVEGK